MKSYLKVAGLAALVMLVMMISGAGAVPYAYVPEGNNLYVIDIGNNAAKTTIAMNDEVGDLVATETKVYILEGSSGVAVIDARTNQRIKTIDTGVGTVGIRRSPDTSRVFVTHGDNSQYVTVIDTESDTVLDPVNVGYGVEEIDTSAGTGAMFFVTGNTLQEMEMSDGKVYRSAVLPVTGHVNFIEEFMGTYAYVSITTDDGRSILYQIDIYTMDFPIIAQNDQMGPGVQGMAMNIVTDEIFITESTGSMLYVLDYYDVSKVIKTIAVDSNPVEVEVSQADADQAIVISSGSGVVDLVNADTGTSQVMVSLGGSPSCVAVIHEELITAPIADFAANITEGYAPLNVKFTDASTGALSYSWDFGDGSSSIEKDPEHVFIQAGLYTVTLTASNNAGSSSKTVTINAIEKPALKINDFTFETRDIIGRPTGWEETYENPDTQIKFTLTGKEGKNIFYVDYISEGTYDVTLKVWDNKGHTDSMTKTDYLVVDHKLAGFASDVVKGTAPLTVKFTDTSNNDPNAWDWFFGDGQNSTEQNPTHVYKKAGTYRVVHTAIYNATEGATLGTVTVEKYITVISDKVKKPVASFTTDKNSGNAPLIVQFTSTSTNSPIKTVWVFGDGTTSNTVNPKHTYTEAGTYTVSLIATNVAGSGIVTVKKCITVKNKSPFSRIGGRFGR